MSQQLIQDFYRSPCNPEYCTIGPKLRNGAEQEDVFGINSITIAKRKNSALPLYMSGEGEERSIENYTTRILNNAEIISAI